MPNQPKSLTDAEIRSTFTQNYQQYNAALVAAKALYDKMQSQEESAQAGVPVADLRKIVLTLFAFQKLLGESDPELRQAVVDTGSNCDYNPFNKVNWLV
jgi:hypothetical protein